MRNAGEREMLIYWIREEKTAQRALQEAKEGMQSWLRRAQLAQTQGRHDLAEAAHARVREHHVQARQAQARLDEAKREREKAAFEMRRPDGSTLQRAAQIMENFRAAGIEPTLAGLAAPAQSMQSQDPEIESQLQALRAKLGMAPAPPLAAAATPGGATSTSGSAASTPGPRPPAAGAAPKPASDAPAGNPEDDVEAWLAALERE